uniref:Uncharacterized protein n=1 Tax=Cacopsylla melanoneura TaxID=428564 RepID=A0A8D8LM85_9HEMI
MTYLLPTQYYKYLLQWSVRPAGKPKGECSNPSQVRNVIINFRTDFFSSFLTPQTFALDFIVEGCVSLVLTAAPWRLKSPISLRDTRRIDGKKYVQFEHNIGQQ